MDSTSWTEVLTCPNCGRTGTAPLSATETLNNSIDLIPDGFKVSTSSRGDDFFCAACNIPVRP